VVARVYDPRKSEIYQRLGLHTISTTMWGIQRIAELLCYSELETIYSLGDGQVELVEVEIPKLLVGATVNELTVLGEIHVVTISRNGKIFLPTLGSVFQVGDRVQLAVLASSVARLHTLLGVA
jgi:trk system potassium uptake protein TrkA